MSQPLAGSAPIRCLVRGPSPKAMAPPAEPYHRCLEETRNKFSQPQESRPPRPSGYWDSHSDAKRFSDERTKKGPDLRPVPLKLLDLVTDVSSDRTAYRWCYSTGAARRRQLQSST